MRNLLPKINSKDGQFHNGNPATGEQGTRVTAEWLNDVQAHLQDVGIEIRYLLAKAAMTPDPAKQTQIYDALIKIINDNRRRASTTAVGEVQLTNDTGLDSESLGLTAKAGKALAQAIAAVKLALNNYIPLNKRSDSVVSTSSDTIATSKAAKTAYDKGVEAKTAADNANNNANGRVAKSGDTMTGVLSLKYGDYSYINQYNTTVGKHARIETLPDNNMSFYKISYRTLGGADTEHHAVVFPKSGLGKIVAYQDWVDARIAGLWVVDGDFIHSAKRYVSVAAKDSAFAGLNVRRSGTAGNWEARIEALPDKRWKFWVKDSCDIYLPAKSGTIALTSDLTKTNVGLGNVQNYGASDTGGSSNYVLRNAAGDIVVRTLKSTYVDEGYCKGAIAFRVNNGTDNHTRYCNSPAAVRSWLQLAPTRRDYNRTIKGVRTWDNGSQQDINISGQVIAATDGRIEQFFHYKNFRVPWFDLEDVGKDGARGYIIPCQLWTAMPNKVTKVQIQFIRATGASNQSTTYLAEAGEWLTAWAYYKQGTNKSQIWINVNRVEGDQDNHIDMLVWVEGY